MDNPARFVGGTAPCERSQLPEGADPYACGGMEKNTDQKLLASKIFMIAMIMMLCAGAAELSMAQWSSLFAERALGVSKVMGDLLGLPCSRRIWALEERFTDCGEADQPHGCRCSYVRFMRGVLPACFAGQQPGVCADGMLTLRPCSQSALAGHAQLFLGMLPGRRYGDARDTCDLRGYWMFHWAVDHGFCIGRAQNSPALVAQAAADGFTGADRPRDRAFIAILFPIIIVGGIIAMKRMRKTEKLPGRVEAEPER